MTSSRCIAVSDPEGCVRVQRKCMSARMCAWTSMCTGTCMLMHSCAHALVKLRVCVREHVYDYYTMCPPRRAHVRACVWGAGGYVHTF